MDIKKFIKLKKYIFLISVLSLVVTLGHLIYLYLYEDAEFKPLWWGVISEWLIGNAPSLNPFNARNSNDKYIMSFLYRSLMKYDPEEWKIVSDLADCEIENLIEVECYLENNLKWSDWSDIKSTDILATYNILKETDVNPLLKSLLSETEISEWQNIIRFQNNVKDINFLNVLFTPIVNESVINSLWEEELNGNFPTVGWIYSWKYKLNWLNRNNSLWIIDVSVTKNEEYFQNDAYLEKIIFKFFKDTSHFLKHKDSINIFNDVNNILWNSVPRLTDHKYTLPQYVSIMLNKDKLEDKNLRNLILNKIDVDNLLKILWKDFFQPVNNPYLTEESIENEPENKNLSELFKNLGYYKKSDLLKSFIEEKSQNLYSEEVKIEEVEKAEVWNKDVVSSTWATISKITKEDILKDYWWKSKTITSPTFIDKYNFITRDDLLLIWKVDDWVDNVYINDSLVPYDVVNKTFNYKLSTKENNLVLWENSYNIYFEIDWSKKHIEELFFIFNEDKAKLERDKDIFIEKIVDEQNKLLSRETREEKIEIPVIDSQLDNEEFDKINSLDDNLFYDKDLKPLSLNLLYIESEKNIETTAIYVKSALEQEWINVNIFPVKISDLNQIVDDSDDATWTWTWALSEELKYKKDYDIIIVWVNLGLFDFNIFPYFHSSQAELWYNFSNFKKLNLDILLEELKSAYLNKNEVAELQKKVLKILKDEQIVKTLYTPIINNLVDVNIKNYNLNDKLPNKRARIESIYNSYIIEQKFINIKDKSVIWFIKFLFSKIHE